MSKFRNTKKKTAFAQWIRGILCLLLILCFSLLSSVSTNTQTRAETDIETPASEEEASPTPVLASDTPAPSGDAVEETPAPEQTEAPQAEPEPEVEDGDPEDTDEFAETDAAKTPLPEEEIAPEESETTQPTQSAAPQGKDWGKYPNASSSSEKAFRKGNILVAAQMRILKEQTNARILELSRAVGAETFVLPTGWESWFMQVLSLYAVQNDCASDFPYGVQMESAKDVSALGSLYWDLTRIVVKEEDGTSVVSIECKDIFWAAAQSAFTKKQNEQFIKLLTVENVDTVRAVANESILSAVDDAEWELLLRNIPENLSGKRRAVLLAALSLQDKVSYFWAGKSTVNGWDTRWGEKYVVDREGDGSYGTAKPFGLDCSGYITWVFVNASSSQKTASSIGNGSANQWKNSRAIVWADLRPGDLVFKQAPGDEGINHVGIAVYIGEDGMWRIAQCGYAGKGVVLTAMEEGEFRYARRPKWYGDE